MLLPLHQYGLIRRGQRGLHRRLGPASVPFQEHVVLAGAGFLEQELGGFVAPAL